MDGQTERQTKRQTERKNNVYLGCCIKLVSFEEINYGIKDKQTDRQKTNKETDRQKKRQIDRII